MASIPRARSAGAQWDDGRVHAGAEPSREASQPDGHKAHFTVVNTADGKRFKVFLRPDDFARLKASKIKRTISQVTAFPLDSFDLLLEGVLLEDAATGAEMGLCESSVLALRPRSLHGAGSGMNGAMRAEWSKENSHSSRDRPDPKDYRGTQRDTRPASPPRSNPRQLSSSTMFTKSHPPEGTHGDNWATSPLPFLDRSPVVLAQHRPGSSSRHEEPTWRSHDPYESAARQDQWAAPFDDSGSAKRPAKVYSSANVEPWSVDMAPRGPREAPSTSLHHPPSDFTSTSYDGQNTEHRASQRHESAATYTRSSHSLRGGDEDRYLYGNPDAEEECRQWLREGQRPRTKAASMVLERSEMSMANPYSSSPTPTPAKRNSGVVPPSESPAGRSVRLFGTPLSDTETAPSPSHQYYPSPITEAPLRVPPTIPHAHSITALQKLASGRDEREWSNMLRADAGESQQRQTPGTGNAEERQRAESSTAPAASVEIPALNERQRALQQALYNEAKKMNLFLSSPPAGVAVSVKSNDTLFHDAASEPRAAGQGSERGTVGRERISTDRSTPWNGVAVDTNGGNNSTRDVLQGSASQASGLFAGEVVMMSPQASSAKRANGASPSARASNSFARGGSMYGVMMLEQELAHAAAPPTAMGRESPPPQWQGNSPPVVGAGSATRATSDREAPDARVLLSGGGDKEKSAGWVKSREDINPSRQHEPSPLAEAQRDDTMSASVEKALYDLWLAGSNRNPSRDDFFPPRTTPQAERETLASRDPYSGEKRGDEKSHIGQLTELVESLTDDVNNLLAYALSNQAERRVLKRELWRARHLAREAEEEKQLAEQVIKRIAENTFTSQQSADGEQFGPRHPNGYLSRALIQRALDSIASNDAFRSLQAKNELLLLQLRDEEQQRKSVLSWFDRINGSIRVVVRVRPSLRTLSTDSQATAAWHQRAHGGRLGPEEKGGQGPFVGDPTVPLCDPNDPTELLLDVDRGVVALAHPVTGSRMYEFYRVLSPEASQDDLFAEVAPLAQSVCDGLSVSVIAYGQTGSGKTYTIVGSEGARDAARASSLPGSGETVAESDTESDASGSAAGDDDQVGDAGRGSQVPMMKHMGVLPRAVLTMFHELRKQQLRYGERCFDFGMTCSLVELYNDKAQDLLAPLVRAAGQQFSSITASSTVNTHCPPPESFSHPSTSHGGGRLVSPQCDVKVLANGLAAVVGLTTHPIRSPEEALMLLSRGTKRRQVHATKQNPFSSRSHTIFSVEVIVRRRIGDAGEADASGRLSANSPSVRRSKMVFVDLAGSERVAKSLSVGARLREAQFINKSLSALGDVVAALSQQQQQQQPTASPADSDPDRGAHGRSFIPYRNSKLTLLLQDCLGGSSKTLLIACVAPNDPPYETNTGETSMTLQFASRVRCIRNMIPFTFPPAAARFSTIDHGYASQLSKASRPANPTTPTATVKLSKSTDLGEQTADVRRRRSHSLASGALPSTVSDTKPPSTLRQGGPEAPDAANAVVRPARTTSAGASSSRRMKF